MSQVSARQKRNRRRARRQQREIRRAMRVIAQGIGAPALEQDEHFIAFTHPDVQADLREALRGGEIGSFESVRLVRVPK